MATTDTRHVDPHAAVRDCAAALRVAGWEPEQFTPITTTWTAPNGRQMFLTCTATGAQVSGTGFTLHVTTDADPADLAELLTAAIGALA